MEAKRTLGKSLRLKVSFIEKVNCIDKFLCRTKQEKKQIRLLVLIL